MEVKLKKNPTRIVIPKYGNGLMLLMEYASNYKTMPILRNVNMCDECFEIELSMTLPSAQGVKKYIVANL